jgi:glutamate-1-semialdehyde 2,1-aminomutase
MSKSQELYKKAKNIIPGGTQLLSKRPELFLPGNWPAYFTKAKGCEIWDMDGIRYFDTCFMGIGTNIIGYADDDVNKAVSNVVQNGNTSTLNAPEEVELAEMLIKLHPWASKVRYARSGGEAMAIAVRIARAHSKKDKVLFCGYHGWHDWYLAANIANEEALNGHLIPGLSPLGVPRNLKGTALPFRYNDIEGFKHLIKEHLSEIGAIVMEPIRNEDPDEEFIKTIQDVSKENSIPLVIDEVSSGWRLNIGGAHLLYKLEPDIAVFAKGISNGYPMAAIIGKENIMDIVQETFISSTYWTERIGPTAAIATIKKMQNNNIQDHLIRIGKEVKHIWKEAADEYNLELKISGIDPLCHFDFINEKPIESKTLFTQEMLEQGFLASNSFYVCYAHTLEILEKYKYALRKSFKIIKKAIEQNSFKSVLKGSNCQVGFKRLI